jgi:hypothetical protein
MFDICWLKLFFDPPIHLGNGQLGTGLGCLTYVSLNNSNHRTVGTYWFLKRRCWMEVCSCYVFVCFFCDYIFAICKPFFHKTLVNVQPLNPPLFEKIAPHSTNYEFSCFFFAFAFLFLLLFLLIFGSPLAPTWARMG